MYIGNGETREFPLPYGDIGGVFYSYGDGRKIKLAESAYRIEGEAEKNVVFEIPPPEGVTISFDAGGETGVKGVCAVIYPDGTVREISEDPYVLLAEAKAERDEAKKLLKSAVDANEKTERFVKIEADIAKEKLSGRIERYSLLVDDSVKSAAAAAADETKEALRKFAEAAMETEARIIDARDEIRIFLNEARSAAEESAENAAATVRERCACAEDALSEIRTIKESVMAMRTEAVNAAVSAGADASKLAAGLIESVIEEVRSMKAAVGSETAAAIGKTRAEAEGMTSEVRNALSEIRAAAANVLAVERRIAETDEAQRTREAGMKALWERMSEFRKRLDARKAREEEV
jgi:hypothetical protein